MSAPTEFMLQLHKDLLEKKKVAESTASAYVKALVVLNEKKPFKNLTFLKDTEAILKKIEASYAPSTQRTILGTIAGVLGTYDDKPAYKKLQKWYSEKLMAKAEEMKGGAEETNTKTEKQKENWAEWEDVSKLRDDLLTKVSQQKEARGKKTITEAEYDDLLHLFVLSLYTYIQPRRNRDYMDMVFWNENKKSPVEEASKDRNYLVFDKKEPIKFIYNVYKTSKTYGKQEAEIPPELANVIKMYVNAKRGMLVNGESILQAYDGTALKANNTITRILNKVFDKKVGSSMLRHSFLSSKYDVGEMKADAEAMGHSVSQQREYMKEPEPTLIGVSGMGHCAPEAHLVKPDEPPTKEVATQTEPVKEKKPRKPRAKKVIQTEPQTASPPPPE